MRLSRKQLQTLQLSKIERKIFFFLEGLGTNVLGFGRGISVTALGEKIGVARTSLYLPLRTLRKRGLVETIGAGMGGHWTTKSNAEITLLFRTMFEDAEKRANPFS